jgi:lysine 2,3-aminomutase
VIARRNPDALWISGYEDRILYDGRLEETGDKFGPLLAALGPALINAAE